MKEASLKGLEWLLWATATLCLCTLVAVCALAFRSQLIAFAMISTVNQPRSSVPVLSDSKPTRPGDVIGLLEIRPLGLSVPITAGVESSSLLRGVGHVEGTALPGGLGTLGLAGHRDTYFRPLRPH